MTVSTPDYWSIDGTPLQTLGWGIATFGGTLEAPPGLRGASVAVPYRAGELWRPRQPEARDLTFPMWVGQCDADGVWGGVEQLEENWAALRALFWGSPGRQLSIVRRSAGGYIEATGQGVFAGGLEPVSHGLQVLKFTADVHMADPWFYTAVQSLGAMAVGTHAIDPVGDVASPRVTVALVGPLTNPSIAVKRGSVTLSTLTCRGSLAAGATHTIALPDGTVTGTATAVTAASWAPGQAPWVDLPPDATHLVVGGSGAGSVTVSYAPAWI